MWGTLKAVLAKPFREQGYLLLRLAMGGMYMAHGFPKLIGGPEKWEKVGMAVSYLGIDFWPVLWGLMAACSEFFGGMFIALGLLFRPAAAMVTVTMIVAITMHVGSGDGFTVASHAITNALVLLSMIVMGPGKYSLDAKIFKGETH